MTTKKNKLDVGLPDLVTNNGMPPNKKNKPDDETARLKKANRLKENLRQMLLPENSDDQDTKKKNAIYAYNFFEKVEETFVNSGEEFKFNNFVQILKTFDPENENAVNLYHKLEKLFLPEHPDLLEIFLTFLQPSEAYRAGKFFEHFMVTNMNTFINKLNLYFNKQPAQIRKIYNCLNELSEDTEISLEKIKNKILPLLKGNQFLTDWFLQTFPDEKPPESLFQCVETVSLKDIDSNQSGGICENIQAKDLMDDFLPSAQSCQLRYINGRIFYGSRLLLPAKLAFMAEPLNKEENFESDSNSSTQHKCAHGIRQLGEAYLKAKDNVNNCNDEKNKSDDFDQNNEQQCYEFCDESVLRTHAARLNPSLYSNETVSSNFYRTNRSEDGKSSPKKQLNRASSSTPGPIIKEKFKSPRKNLLKSPMSGTNNSTSKKSAGCETNILATARKLKALCDEINDNNLDEPNKIKKRKIQKIKFKSQDGGTESLSELGESENEIDTYEAISSEITKSQPWTREEDKIILEEVKLGFELHEELMNRIEKKLTGRFQNEINLRYKFLMDVLSQLKNKN